jgi:hypothetical protein
MEDYFLSEGDLSELDQAIKDIESLRIPD